MTDLYSLLVVFKNSPHTIRFLYKSEQTVKDAYDVLKVPPLIKVDEGESGTSFEKLPDNAEIQDDYGNTATIDRSQVAACVNTFINNDLEGQTEFSILQAHGQAKAQRRAAADPMLKQGLAVPQGPIINSKPPLRQ